MSMKIGMEILQGIIYKRRIMGDPIYGPSYIYGDTISFILNTQHPESTLKKRRNYICYHDVRESVAICYYLTRHIGTNNNCADLSTKVFYCGKRKFHVSNLLYIIYDDM